MKENNKYILILLLTLILSYPSYANNHNDCSDKEWYKLYECRKINICKKEYWEDNSNKKEIKFIYKTEKYNKKINWYWLEDAKKIYRNNQNNIYKCWILKIQQDTLKLIKDKLIKNDKSGAMKDRFGKTIIKEIKGLKEKIDKIWCKNTKTPSLQNKLNILNNSTYELCNYNYYLEYLKEYDSNMNNVLLDKTNTSKNKQYSIKEVSDIMPNIQNIINNEIDNSYYMFPLAYNAYTEYENNYLVHVLLKLIREDYIILRNKLYSALNPINQFVYKLANAMKMP